jgi:hypothetical protein
MADGRVSTAEYKKIGGIREPVPSLKPSGLYYSNRAEARRSVGKLNWMPPANNSSIPKTDNDMAVWVLALRNAVEDMSSYADSESIKLQKRWLDADWVKGRVPQRWRQSNRPLLPPALGRGEVLGDCGKYWISILARNQYANHQAGVVHSSASLQHKHNLLPRPAGA